MSTGTSDLSALLSTCLEDLYAGRCLAAEALPPIGASVGKRLSDAVYAIAQAYRDQSRDIGSLEDIVDPADNLWMAGIMRDARRDTETIKAGALRDIAIIGAVRKALVADEVSLETAVAIAQRLERHRVHDALKAMQSYARTTDDQFRDLLYAMTTGTA